jgi:hypothetical protein
VNFHHPRTSSIHSRRRRRRGSRRGGGRRSLFGHAGENPDTAEKPYGDAMAASLSPHRVDHAAEFDEAAVAGALDDAPVVRGDGGIDQIAAQPPEPRQGAVLVGAREPAVADDVGHQDRGSFGRLVRRVAVCEPNSDRT